MAFTSTLFENFWDQALSSPINYPSDTIKMSLHTASPGSLLTAIHYSDLTSEVASGAGYTTGGVTLGTKTHTVTPGTTWSPTWANQAWVYGQIVRPTAQNGFVYMCSTAGSGNATQPTWPTVVGQTVTEASGGVIWTCVGESVTIWSSAAASWSASTFSASYGVIYDAQSGTGSTEPLIALLNFGTTLSPVAGTLTVSPDATYGWFLTTPA